MKKEKPFSGVKYVETEVSKGFGSFYRLKDMYKEESVRWSKLAEWRFLGHEESFFVFWQKKFFEEANDSLSIQKSLRSIEESVTARQNEVRQYRNYLNPKMFEYIRSQPMVRTEWKRGKDGSLSAKDGNAYRDRFGVDGYYVLKIDSRGLTLKSLSDGPCEVLLPWLEIFHLKLDRAGGFDFEQRNENVTGSIVFSEIKERRGVKVNFLSVSSALAFLQGAQHFCFNCLKPIIKTEDYGQGRDFEVIKVIEEAFERRYGRRSEAEKMALLVSPLYVHDFLDDEGFAKIERHLSALIDRSKNQLDRWVRKE